MEAKMNWMAVALMGAAGCVCVGAARATAQAMRTTMHERVGLYTAAMQVTRLRKHRSVLSPTGDRRTGWVRVGFVPATRTVFGRERVWVSRAPTTGQQGSRWRGMLMMAQPRKKLPERSVDVCCMKCKFKLYKVGVGWQRRCETGHSLRKLGHQAAFLSLAYCCGDHDDDRVGSYCAVWRTSTARKGDDRTTWCSMIQERWERFLGEVLQGTHSGRLHGWFTGVSKLRRSFREGNNGAWQAGV